MPCLTSRGALHGGTDAVESLGEAGGELPGVPVRAVGADEGPQHVVGHAVANAVAVWHDGAEAATAEGRAVQGGRREVEVVGPLEAGVGVQCGLGTASLLGQALQGKQVPVKALACTTEYAVIRLVVPTNASHFPILGCHYLNCTILKR